MNRALLAIIVAIAGTSTLASAVDATTIVNGSFEDGPATTNGYYIELGTDSTAIPGWIVGGNSIDYINPSHPYWVAEDGIRALDLSGSAPGAISQTLATAPGQAYIVSFYMAGNPDGVPVVKSLSVDINGSGVRDYFFDTTGVTSYAALGWTLETYRFTATGRSSVLTFTDLDTGSPYGAALDNVSIVTVGSDIIGNGGMAAPEPAAWAMMILGIGGIGATMRASRRKAATALV